MNPNMAPPVPPPHFPPGHPEGPRIIQNQTPGPINPMHLADQMGRLNINTERVPRGRNSDEGLTSPWYEGYTFFKADPVSGQKATWSRAERTKMHLSQNELIKLVQKKSKKTPSSLQYQKLSKPKRHHVDQLIDEHRMRDPRAEWNCVYVKEVEKPYKGKDSRRGDYETVSMDIVIVRKPLSSATSRSSLVDLDSPVNSRERSINFDRPFPENIRPINRGMEDNGPWPRPNVPPGQFHPPMHGQQQFPPQFHQQHPPMAHGPPMGGPSPMGGPQPMFQGPMQGQMPRPPMPPGNHPPPGMHAPQQPAMKNDPGFEIINAPRGSPQGPGPHHPGQRPDQMHRPFAPSPVNHVQRLSHPKLNHGHLAKSPKMQHHHEPDWSHEASSVEDDESIMFDGEDDSSGTDDTDREIHESFIPGRGSLYRHNSKKQARPEPIYRPHHRHQQTKHLDKKHSQKRYPSDYVVVMPAVSKGGSKRLGKSHHKEPSGFRSRPKITHGLADTPFEEEGSLLDRLRGGRGRNDIRTLLLNDREARLEQREKLVDYQARMLDEPRYHRREPGLYRGPSFLY